MGYSVRSSFSSTSSTSSVDQTPIDGARSTRCVSQAFDPIRELFSLRMMRGARAYGEPLLVQRPVPVLGMPGEGEFCGDAVSRRCFVPCEHAMGSASRQVLEVRYRGKSVHQVLEMTVREALAFFGTSPKVLRRLQVLDEIGLGYLRLGQPATTLSGGEAQRIKIAAHLVSFGSERLLYILDEPTTGLHFERHCEAALPRSRNWSKRATHWSSSSTPSTSSKPPTT